jgi:hypothetical protein
LHGSRKGERLVEDALLEKKCRSLVNWTAALFANPQGRTLREAGLSVAGLRVARKFVSVLPWTGHFDIMGLHPLLAAARVAGKFGLSRFTQLKLSESVKRL